MSLRKLRESALSYSEVELVEALDEGQGWKWRVRVLRQGLSGNGKWYGKRACQDLAHLIESKGQVKVFDGHRHIAEKVKSSTEGLLGWMDEPEYVAGDGTYASFNILKSADRLRESLLDAWNRGVKNLVGFSVDGFGGLKLRRDSETSGKLVPFVESFMKLDSIDVVADPSAGGELAHLVASEEGDRMKPEELAKLMEAMTPDELKQVNPELYDAVIAQAKPEATPPAKEKEGEEPEPGAAKPDGAAPIQEATQPDPAIAELANQVAAMKCGQTLTAHLTEANLPEVLKKSIEKRFTGQVFEEAALREAIQEGQTLAASLSGGGKVEGFGGAQVEVTQEEREKHVKALDGFFQRERSIDGVPAFRTLREAHAVMTHRPGGAYADPMAILRESFESAPLFRDPTERAPYGEIVRLTESLDTTSWAQVLGDSITRAMIREYTEPSISSWRDVVSDIIPVNDFRTQRRSRIGGYGVLPTVNQGAPYQALNSPPDEEATYSIAKKGGTEDLTMEMIANDDVRAIANIPRKLGRAAAWTIRNDVLDILRLNPNCTYDATALFAAGHGNLGATALSSAELNVVRRVFRERVAYGSDGNIEVMNLNIDRIWVPAELEELAFRLCTSATNVNAAETATTPNIQANQGLKYTVVPEWTDATDWVAQANVRDCPTIEVGFFEGQEEPQLLIQDDPRTGAVFSADKITYRIRYIYGTCVLDHRGLYKEVVAG